MDGWHACLKQKTRCVIVVDLGAVSRLQYEATNSCHVEDAQVCPRVTAGSPSGEGYELCGPPKHAEQEAVLAMLNDRDSWRGRMTNAVAYLYGHTWLCMDCQHALTAAGVRTFVVTGQPA